MNSELPIRAINTNVRSSNRRRLLPAAIGLVCLLLLAWAPNASGQGSIAGDVLNSDLTIPNNGEISFVGFLDNTDEEIRIETCTGAGYQTDYWFDDFQNYQTEVAGNPYVYFFHNSANGEGYELAGLIPNNSFQVENITLGTVVWPAAASGLNAYAMPGPIVRLSWVSTPGITYHVYRRVAPSAGSFYRLDNPAGLLTDPGVTDSVFVDALVDGVSSYDYLIIAEDASGNLSPRSAVVTANPADDSDADGIPDS